MELQSVVGQAYVRRERGLSGGVVESVAHVREEGAPWFELIHKRHGALKVRVAVMGLVAQGVEDEDVEILQERKAFGWDVTHVGQVGRAAESIAGDLLSSVGHGDAAEAGAEELHAGAGSGVEAMELDACAGGVAVFRAEGVLEDALKVIRGLVVGVDGEITGCGAGHIARDAKAEGAEVVETEDVVSVAMSVEDGIDLANALAESLRMEVRPGVDEDSVAFETQADGRPGAAVAPVAVEGHRRGAYGAVTAQGRDAHGGSAAKECERRLHDF